MPITRSAKKALRQSKRRHRRNLKKKEAYKGAAQEVKRLAAAGDKDAAAALSRLYQALDKAAKTHAISMNKASRLKSRLTRFIAKSSAK